MRTVVLLLSFVVILALTLGCTQPATIPAPTAVATLSPVTTSATIPKPPPVSALVTSSPSRADGSGKGVWVRIGTKGAYTGTIGAGGWVQEVNGTGERFYQVPATSIAIVDIYLQNQDTSGQVLSVEVFNDGEMIERRTIMTPRGTIVMAVDLKTAYMPTDPGDLSDDLPVEVVPLPNGMTLAAGAIPHVTSLKYKPGGRYSACSMSLYLPDIVADPDYGLNEPSNSRLVGISDGQYAKITRGSKEKQGAINPCYKVDGLPYWTWLGISATFNQISSQPVTYNITLYANSANLRIPVVSTTETLNPGQDYPFSASIPIKSDQAEKITSMDFGFEPVVDNETR